MAKSQNELLNVVKGIVCICVVFMHCEFPGILGVVVQALTRFSVPFFFMISGYYCFYTSGITPNDKIRAKLKHILVITLNATLFYLAAAYASGKSFDMTMYGVRKWLLFNSPCIVVGQLWFLYALLYDYFLYSIINKTKTHRIACALIPVAFLAYFCLAQGLHIASVKIPNMYYRNWLIEGFAFFMTGYWVHQNQNKLCFKNITLVVVFIVSSLLCLIERYFLGRDFGVNIFSIPQVIALFLYATNNFSSRECWLSILGSRYSMYVYILHPFVWNVLKLIYAKVHLDSNLLASYMMPVFVVIATLIFSHCVYYGNKTIKTATLRNA